MKDFKKPVSLATQFKNLTFVHEGTAAPNWMQ